MLSPNHFTPNDLCAQLQSCRTASWKLNCILMFLQMAECLLPDLQLSISLLHAKP